ncbi:hypothetical protein [Marinibactrum halimedae]|uniref:Uncharacterized protein n=1 Tax=Marinibactrum halimedae TaxID=1444977 RepID=A0AA37T3P5_9GAMM|nr:hypothetical protein [Marinibactrum halimedae]MCD9460300.1 hypothetical protein [Marinibactrum halimedae]GLS24388.1 hypothetical protein GCM10007877_00990 [Marinibactrum halimedae]
MTVKKVIFSIVVSVFLSVNAFGDDILSLSEKDLKPFCSNQQMWDQFNVKPETCMSHAKACAKKNEDRGLNIMQATQELYTCVFDRLGIKMEP